MLVCHRELRIVGKNLVVIQIKSALRKRLSERDRDCDRDCDRDLI